MKQYDVPEYKQVGTPAASPASGSDKLYFKSDDNLYRKDASGYEILIGGVRTPGASAGLLIGDSTVAAYISQGVDYYLKTDADITIGSTILNQAVPGDTIAGQKTLWTNDANKATYDWIIIQVGINSVMNATIIAEYQDLVDTINAGKKPSAAVIVSVINPVHSGMIGYWGAETGVIVNARIDALNEAIMGGGATPITGVSFRINKHYILISDGADSMGSTYDAGDGIHPTNLAKAVMAYVWRETLNLAGFFTIQLPDYIHSIWTTDNTRFFTTNASTPVGIGTTQPVRKLHIVESILNSPALKIENSAPTGYSDIEFVGTGNRFWYLGCGGGSETWGGVANKFFIFDQTATQWRFIVDTNGFIGMGGVVSPQGILDVASTTGAFIPPRMTSTQRDALGTIEGSVVHNTTSHTLDYYNGSAWVSGVSGTSGYSGYSGSGLSGYSGAGESGYSGYSGEAGGDSGYSGYSGFSGTSGDPGGDSGYSGYSGLGVSGYSGYSGEGSILSTPVFIDNTDSPYSASMGESILADATDGAITVNLPAATGSASTISIKKTDSSTNMVTVTADTGGTPDTIDGMESKLLVAQYYSIMIQDVATNDWAIFARNSQGRGLVNFHQTGYAMTSYSGAALDTGDEQCIEGWFSVPSTGITGGQKGIVSRTDLNSVSGDWFIYFTDNTHIYIAMHGGGSAATITVSALNNSVPHHLAFTWNKNVNPTCRLYLDGVEAGNYNNNTSMAGYNTAYPITLGGYYSTSYLFPGTMWEWRYSNNDRYPSGTSFTPPGRMTVDANTICCWHMDEEIGITLTDVGTSGYDATLAGGFTWGSYPPSG